MNRTLLVAAFIGGLTNLFAQLGRHALVAITISFIDRSAAVFYCALVLFEVIGSFVVHYSNQRYSQSVTEQYLGELHEQMSGNKHPSA